MAGGYDDSRVINSLAGRDVAMDKRTIKAMQAVDDLTTALLADNEKKLKEWAKVQEENKSRPGTSRTAGG